MPAVSHATAVTDRVRVPPPPVSSLFLSQSQWPVSLHYFQNKSADRASMKRTMKQPPQCMSFTLMFSRLGNAFNYCKMIGSHVRW